MKPGHRVQRFEKEVRELASLWLISGVGEPLPGIPSVSRVVVSADLKLAKIYVQLIGDQIKVSSAGEENVEALLEILERKAFLLQSDLAKKLKARFTPKVKFFYDDTLDHVLKVDKIIRDLELSGELKNRSSQ